MASIALEIFEIPKHYIAKYTTFQNFVKKIQIDNITGEYFVKYILYFLCKKCFDNKDNKDIEMFEIILFNAAETNAGSYVYNLYDVYNYLYITYI